MINRNSAALVIVTNALVILALFGCDRRVQIVEPAAIVSTLAPDAAESSTSTRPEPVKEERPTEVAKSAANPTEIPVAVLAKPEKPDPETLVIKNYTEFIEVAKFYREENAAKTRDFGADISQMKKSFEQLERIAAEFPDSTVAHCAAGEVAFELAAMIQEHLKSDAGVAGIAALLPYTMLSLRDYAWKELRMAAMQGSQNAYTYDRLARLKLIKTGGRWEDPELVEYLLESMRLGPEDGVSIRMLVLALLNSSFINSGAFDHVLIQVLPAQKENARAELERALDFLENEWEESQRHAERAAIMGYIDNGSRSEMMRNAKLKGMLRAALGIGPFDRRTKSTAKN